MFYFTEDYRGWATGERFFQKGDEVERDQLVNTSYLIERGTIVEVKSIVDAEPDGEPESSFELPDGALDVQDTYDLESTGEIVFLTDEQILDVHGVGPARLEGLREWYPFEGEEE